MKLANFASASGWLRTQWRMRNQRPSGSASGEPGASVGSAGASAAFASRAAAAAFSAVARVSSANSASSPRALAATYTP
ncbi:MAG: hypothetical protein BWY56_00477 [Acidobacteria bacterium ADurb.Bin340]|nr:MAG: hypothetical protein BWY56_00477 [Acidobacteria bacterium ADurb.Bin340]